MSGRLIKGNKTIKKSTVYSEDKSLSYRNALEKCLIALCKELDIQVPVWLRKNTSEFAAFQKTFFNSEHFMEEIKFDRFEIEVTQSKCSFMN